MADTCLRAKRAWSAAVAGASLALAATPTHGADLLRQTPLGALRGQSDGAVESYKGVPYATPPVGELRWKPPVAQTPWAGVRTASGFAPACLQPSSPIAFYKDDPPSQSEDCLYLNVWAPVGARKAPVIVWIHGGSLMMGTASTPHHDGRALAAKGAVVVTINYRLGVFGYLAHPELTAESAQGASGNYGTLDQIEALRWVRRNVEAFGGDPEAVTVMGESAGALSAAQLMASPLARGLFQRAIAQSVYLPAMPELKAARFGIPAAEEAGQAFGEKAGDGRLAALRAMPAPALLAAAASQFFMPQGTIDGWVHKGQLVDVFERGEQAPVPLLVGFNSGEVRAFDGPFGPPVPADADAYRAAVRARYCEQSEEYLRLYPAERPRDGAFDAARDAFYAWAAMRLASDQAGKGGAYLYYFDHVYPSAAERGLGAFHASEVPFVFGEVGPGATVPENWPAPPSSARDVAVSQAMMDYWVGFARTGRPQAAGRADWPAFSAKARGYMRFGDDGAKAEGDLLPGVFEFLDDVVQSRRRSGDASWEMWNTGLAAPVAKDCAGA
ncbi:MAG: carboxylesterase [Phenylobacterium sp.]|uniref:carboxylesterase/lipase family protein n=1 Tax=Phenylobacterium sp. TaxID=1871053 RepID=UPI0025CF4B2D|nr:carboxylesterase family protein [Phenylobacterium sp.]MBA4010481.1 carboxylesterase [Phenylobacterium sp.]